MKYNYDIYISYALADNFSLDDNSGFVDEFVQKLRNSEDLQKIFGGKVMVFYDKEEIKSMSDWERCIRSGLASSRFLIILLSPKYFRSEFCAREFDWWIKHETQSLPGESIAVMPIVDVSRLYDYREETIPDMPEELQIRYPNWLHQIRSIQCGPEFDMHDLVRSKIDSAIKALSNEIKEKVQRQSAKERSPRNASFPPYNENFVGRRENLRFLRRFLSESATIGVTALTGLGGFGKTALAVAYSYAFAWDYQLGNVFVNCENKTSIYEALLSSGIAEMNGWELPPGNDEQQISFLFNHLKAKQNEIMQHNMNEGTLITLGAHILLILDNVNKLKLISRENLVILPDYFHVVITTRGSAHYFPYIHTETVGPLSEDESLELLNNLRPFDNPDETQAARNIVRLLGGFTIVVELVGAYLARYPNVTYRQQYEQLEKNIRSDALQEKTGVTQMSNYAVGIIETTLSSLSSNARKALDFASLMSPNAVAMDWLPELCGFDENEGVNALQELIGYSLLTPLELNPKIARMHRLVMDTIKQPEETKKEITAKIRNKCSDLLDKDERFWFASNNSWNIMPVYEFCSILANSWIVEDSEDKIDWNLTRALLTSGDLLNGFGKMDEAKTAFQLCADMCDKIVKKFPLNYTVLWYLSVLYLRLGDSENAAGNADAAREWRSKYRGIRQRLAESDPESVLTRQDLRLSYKRMIDMDNAAGNAESAQEWCEKEL